MELFYNPERMSETEIKETFVAYQWLVDEIISILKRQPKGAGVQHIVIVAPRGMGKTTLLLMLRFTVLSQDISKRWQPVLFPEESYSVYDLADLWVEVLDHIASETGNATLREEVKKLKEAHPDSSSLEAIALASIKDWRDKNKKRLLLLVDNFDMILEQIGDEKDNASLRDVLMNDGTMMLVGGSTTFFKEARAYDQPLYNLFKIYNLDGLDSNQMEDLLRRRAKIDGLENFEEVLRANRSRLRVLEYFTGGNPRLVLMLYRVLTHSDISEVRRGLEKLLDEVTPYYKAKIEALPPQQRKILDQIARISAQTREGLTPTEIASATRLAVNQVSSQLKRLADVGYVRAANIRGRSSYYTLSEPLYAIWHQMRFGRNARQRMNWLVAFLKGWYDAKELGVECQRLLDVFGNYLRSGRESDAREALEHRRYLMEAIEDQASRARMFESIILSYLELHDTDTLQRDVLKGGDLNALSADTYQRLITADLLTKEDIKARLAGKKGVRAEFEAAVDFAKSEFLKGRNDEAAEILTELENFVPNDSPFLFLLRATKAMVQDNTEEWLVNLDNFLNEEPDDADAWHLKGFVLAQNRKLREAADALMRAIDIKPNFSTHYLLGQILADLEQHKDALMHFDRALQFRPDAIDVHFARSHVLAAIGHREEALSSMDRVLSLQPDSTDAWHERGKLLADTGANEEALKSFERAIELKPDSYRSVLERTLNLGYLEKTDEALLSVNRLLELDPESSDAYFLRGMLLISTNFEDGLVNIKRAFDPQSKSHRTHINTVEGVALKIFLLAVNDEPEPIKFEWKELVTLATRDLSQTAWVELASNVLKYVAHAGHWGLARDLISASDLEEPLFPLARGLDHLLGREASSIERLSPEVKSIVDEIVNTLNDPSNDKKAYKASVVTKLVPPTKQDEVPGLRINLK